MAAIQAASERMKRRGILAAAGAVVAGIVAKAASEPVSAAVSVTLGGDGFANVTTAQTTVRNNGDPATVGTIAALVGIRSTTIANAFGGTIGVYGVTDLSNGIGVRGSSQAAGGIGVAGDSTNIGVQGEGIGTGVGVFGTAFGNTAVLGITTAPGFAGLGGIANVAGTAAFAGTSTNPNAFAGFFTGDVLVNGNFTVVDPTRKHGAIAHPDGSYRLLYSMESPESWIEDFGTGTLAGGKASVTLDKDFAAIVETGDYAVFPVPLGECKGLYVTNQTPSGFEVWELQGGTSGVAFRYRVVAKPKTTNKAARMAKFVIPDIKVPQPPSMPDVPVGKMPDAPPQPVPPSRPASSTVPPAVAPPQGSGTTQGSTTSPVQPAPPPRP